MNSQINRVVSSTKLTIHLLGSNYVLARLWENRNFRGKLLAIGLVLSAIIAPLILFTAFFDPRLIWGMIIAVFVGIILTMPGSAIILFMLIWSNEEHERLAQDTDNFIKPPRFFMGAPAGSVSFTLDKNSFYAIPPVIETLYRGMNVDKETYFRLNANPLDIPKVTLQTLQISEKGWNMRLGACSFKDVFFTHYFADYPLGVKRAEDIQPPSLRNLLTPTIDDHYRKQSFPSKKTPAQKLDWRAYGDLPNPLGITGIVTIQNGKAVDNNSWHLLQTRHLTEAADRGRLQWSFAGTLDLFPDLFVKHIDFDKLIRQELEVEIIKPINDDFGLFEHCNLNDRVILGLILNPQLLYQPELIVWLKYEATNEGVTCIEKLAAKTKRWSTSTTSIAPRYLTVQGIEGIKQLMNDSRVNPRQLFDPILEMLETAIARPSAENAIGPPPKS